MKTKIIAKNKEHLELLIKEEVKKFGYECNLNHIDTSLINDMSLIFANSYFNGNISHWNTENVKNMQSLFYCSYFNGDISLWNVSNVINMDYMFLGAHFNKNISQWNVSNVKKMHSMFYNSQFNGDISLWEISKVKNMSDIFEYNDRIEKPWWAIENSQQRKTAIEKYHLMQKIDNKLTTKDNKQTKKNKI